MNSRKSYYVSRGYKVDEVTKSPRARDINTILYNNDTVIMIFVCKISAILHAAFSFLSFFDCEYRIV